jgi:hypothetical protein
MPQLKLTQIAVDRLRPPPTEAVTYWDVQCPGFGLRVSPKGRKTWVAQYRVRGGKEVLETIGTTALIPNVGEARERARASMLLARQGVHPGQRRKAAEAAVAAEETARQFTFAKLVERYMAEYAALNTKPSTAAETRRLLSRAQAAFGDRAISEIRKIDIVELISSSRKPGSTGTAGLLALARAG